MSYTRYFLQLAVFSVLLLPTCFGQASCLPLGGSDANHPNGLFLQVVPQKQYSGPRQNSSSTYIFQIGNATQILWDATQGLHAVLPAALSDALKAELSACLPKPVNPPTPPPQSVPYYNTPLINGAHILAITDFNGDRTPDAVLAVPGTNQLSVYIGNTDGTFKDPLTVTLGTAATRISSLGVADFNADRKVDVAVVDSVNNAVYVLYGKGDGNFFGKSDGSYAPLTIPVGHSPAGIAVVDVNADGRADIAVANSADNTVSVIRGNGDGTFVPASTFAVGKNPVALIAFDANNDGNLDLLVADSGSSDIASLYGLGNGGFQNAVFTKTPAPPTYLTSADFNNDGVRDVVALSTDLNAVMLFTGGFQGKLTLTGNYLVPNLSNSFSVNDFDGDGNLDLLVPDTDSGSPILFLGRGDGTLYAPPVYGAGNGLTSVSSGDFNNDGKADLVVTGSNPTASTLSILTGTGTGQFQNPVNIPVSGRTDVAAVGDFNKDGRLDIAVSGAQLNILLGQGNGTFQPGAQYPNLTPSVVADFNKDGRPDIAGPFNGGLGVMIGNGDGTFRAAVPFPVGSNPKTAAAADFNVDGSADIAVLNGGTPGNSSDPGGVTILLGNGTGSFPRTTNVATGVNPRAFAVGDVNGDGKPDMAVASGVSPFQLSVFLGKGDGTFAEPFAIPLPAGETPNALAIVDLDGDGNPDIVLGSCCTDATTAYFRGNGDGTFQPIVSFYGGNNVRAIVVGDWNGDGRSDLAMAYGPAASPSVTGIAALLNHPGKPWEPSSLLSLSITSGASFVPGPVAPDSIVSAFGTTLTTGTGTATGDPGALPTTLANTSVTVKDSAGVARPASLYYVSPTQVNFLVPPATALGNATISVNAPNGVTATKAIVIGTAPGLFTVNSSGLAAGGGVHVQGNQQFAFNLAFPDATSGQVIPVPINLGGKNDQVFLTLFGTGFRNRTSLEGVSVSIGGVYSPPLYAGPQTEFPGLDQLNVQIPQSLAGSGKVIIQLIVNGVPANPVNVIVQ